MTIPRGCPVSRTLETALRDSGINDEDISAETKRCEDYLQRAHELKTKSLDLCECEVRATYDVLRGKRNRGETLTPEEEKNLDRACEILSTDH